jgi:hypothetical protein
MRDLDGSMVVGVVIAIIMGSEFSNQTGSNFFLAGTRACDDIFLA